jgi:chromosomal replication initiation ATPase DnaA
MLYKCLSRNPRLFHLRNEFFAELSAAEKIQVQGLDARRYRAMRSEYHDIRARYPLERHCTIALKVGARAFGFKVDDILDKSDRDPKVNEARQKIIAFAKVITGQVARHVAFAFDRDHHIVTRAVRRYGAEIKAVLADE